MEIFQVQVIVKIADNGTALPIGTLSMKRATWLLSMEKWWRPAEGLEIDLYHMGHQKIPDNLFNL